MAEPYDTGLKVRREVLGSDHVDRASTAMTALDERFQHMITEAAWGRTWTGEQLTRRERSLITLSLLAALGHWDEFELHLRASRNTGATPADIADAMMHVATYAGVPAANSAYKRVKAVLGDDA